ncbi:MAG: hypothetical protein OXG82_00280 [Gammaproteobacteria bacterium]|nr:hypothetical protein [Gammaproteobacteria bacterium]
MDAMDIEQLAAELKERLHLATEEMEALRVLLYEHIDGVERRLDERLRRLEEREPA